MIMERGRPARNWTKVHVVCLADGTSALQMKKKEVRKDLPNLLHEERIRILGQAGLRGVAVASRNQG